MATKKQINEQTKKVKACLRQININDFVEKSIKCGVITEKELKEDNYLIAKHIIYAYAMELEFQFGDPDKKRGKVAQKIYSKIRF